MMGKYAWNYLSEDGCVYTVDPVSGNISRNCPIRDAAELPRDLVEAIKAAKFSVRVNNMPVVA
ncbi:MAG: hypothetical protein LBL45_03955 [Treponema sp.]|jgi:hypothetical protein|nr:hypothetical protein [Treponema sp.]